MKLIKYNIALLLAILFTACTTDITLDLKGATPELALEGAITTDTMAHSIYLKKTANFFSNQAAEVIAGAIVTLSDGQNTITLAEDNLKKGIYQTPATYYGVAGRTYTLTIDNVDVNSDGVNEKYMATCPINATIQLDSIDVKKERIFQQDVFSVKAWFQEPADEKNYYLIRLYKNDISISDSIQEWGISDDEFYNGKYITNETMMYFFADKKDELLQKGDKVTLEVSGLTKDYNKYILEVQTEFFGRNPLFGGQPANVRTNIKQVLPVNGTNNPHGYFAAYSVSWAHTVYNGQ